MQSAQVRQLMAVLRTYTSWWLTGLAVTLYVVGILLVMVVHRGPNTLSSSVGIDFAGEQLGRLPADLTTVRSLVLNSDQLDKALRPDSPLQIAGALPNLKRLVVYASVNESQLIAILRHQRLASLVLVHLEALSDGGWEAFAGQPLQELQIMSMDRSLWEPGRWPTTVRTLLVQDDLRPIQDLARSHLEPLLRLPSLATLKVRLIPDKDGHLKTADRDALLQMPALKYLFIDGLGPSLISDVQKELPRIAVRPAAYDAGRVHQVLSLMGLGFVPLLLILHVVSLQFVSPASWLIPNYHRRHWQLALCLFLVCGFTQTVAMVISGCELFAAVGLACAALVPIFVLTILMERTSRFPGFTHFQFIMIVLLSFPVLALLMLAREAESDWMISGHRLEIPAMLIAFELGSLIGLKGFFSRLCRRLTENAQGAVPFGLWDVKGFEKWSVGSSNALNWQERLWGHSQEQRLLAARDSLKTAANHQSLLWRASQQMTAFWFAAWMAGAMTIGVIVVIPFIARMIQSQFIWWNLWMQVTMFLWFIPFMRLMQQRPYLSRHLLSSCGRQDWVRLIFRETARDFAPAGLLAAAGLVGYCVLGPAHGWSTPHVAALAAALLCTTYGISLLLVTFSPLMQAVLAIGGFVATMVLVFVPLAALSQFAPATVDNVLQSPPIWWVTLLAVAALLISAAYRRWMIWELASIPS